MDVVATVFQLRAARDRILFHSGDVAMALGGGLHQAPNATMLRSIAFFIWREGVALSSQEVRFRASTNAARSAVQQCARIFAVAMRAHLMNLMANRSLCVPPAADSNSPILSWNLEVSFGKPVAFSHVAAQTPTTPKSSTRTMRGPSFPRCSLALALSPICPRRTVFRVRED